MIQVASCTEGARVSERRNWMGSATCSRTSERTTASNCAGLGSASHASSMPWKHLVTSGPSQLGGARIRLDAGDVRRRRKLVKRAGIGATTAPHIENARPRRLAEDLLVHERNDDPVRTFDVGVRRTRQVEGEGSVHADAPQSWLRPPGRATRNCPPRRAGHRGIEVRPRPKHGYLRISRLDRSSKQPCDHSSA